MRIEKIPEVENKSESKEEEKENVETAASGCAAAKRNLNINIITAEKSGAPRTKLISDSYYNPLTLGQENDKKSSSKVKFSEQVDTNEISANEQDSNVSASELGESDGPIKEDGRVRGRQRYNKVVQVKKPSENENDQCKTQ